MFTWLSIRNSRSWLLSESKWSTSFAHLIYAIYAISWFLFATLRLSLLSSCKDVCTFYTIYNTTDITLLILNSLSANDWTFYTQLVYRIFDPYIHTRLVYFFSLYLSLFVLFSSKWTNDSFSFLFFSFAFSFIVRHLLLLFFQGTSLLWNVLNYDFSKKTLSMTRNGRQLFFAIS